MQNYKVEVKNHSEVTEVQELFFGMGYRKGVCIDSRYPKLIVTANDGDDWYSAGVMICRNNKYKKITLQELRAMVSVQKYEELAKKYDGVKTKQLPNGIQFKKNKASVTIYPSTGTIVSDVCGKINVLKKAGIGKLDYELNKHFSVIITKQKEYLVKTDTGYTLQVLSDVIDGHDGIIEVPKDAMSYWERDRTSVNFFLKLEGGCHFYHYLNKNSEWALWNDADFKTFEMKWQRESLNDQVASAEQARQEQTQTREISECDLIDSGKLIIGGLGESFPVGLEHHKFIQPEGFSEGGFIPKQNHGAPVGLLHHGFGGFTQPEELPFIDDNAWNKQIGGDHYKKLAIQPMEYALQNKLDYAQANVVKYVTRHADKNGKQDLLKAIHNIELMIAHYYSDQE